MALKKEEKEKRTKKKEGKYKEVFLMQASSTARPKNVKIEKEKNILISRIRPRGKPVRLDTTIDAIYAQVKSLGGSSFQY